MAVCFALIPNEAKKLKRNKAKQNKLRREITENNCMFCFALNRSETIETKQSETSEIF